MNLLDYFQGNPETYVTQRKDGGYYRVSEPFTEQVILDHLSGKITASFYPLFNKQTKVLVFDADDPVESELNTVGQRTIELSNLLSAEKVKHITEWSGRRGYHIWLFFDNPINAVSVFSWAQSLVSKVNSRIFGPIEIMPTTGGLGHAIKLPLGIHRKTGKRSRFVINSNLERFIPEEDPSWLKIQLALLEATGFNQSNKIEGLAMNIASKTYGLGRYKPIQNHIDIGIWSAYHQRFQLADRYWRASCRCDAHTRGDQDPSLVGYFDAPDKAHCFKTGVTWGVEDYFRRFVIEEETELQSILKKYGYKANGE